jgi:hypothetical protein
LLSLVKTHAILHQTSRQRDAHGCLIATLEDYAVVRGVVVDILSEGIDATVGLTLRETVEAVKNLTGARVKTVSITQLARELNLDKSATSRRVKEALDLGYLRNHAKRKGLPARLVVGDPLPENIEVLPDAEVLQCCRQKGEVNTPSTVRTERDLFASEDGEAEVRL